MKNPKCCICKKEDSEYEIETPNYIFDVCMDCARDIENYINKKKGVKT